VPAWGEEPSERDVSAWPDSIVSGSASFFSVLFITLFFSVNREYVLEEDVFLEKSRFSSALPHILEVSDPKGDAP